MESVFELKTKTMFDFAVFEHMKEQAIELLSNVEYCQYTQAVVLLSATGNEYSTIIKNALSEEKTDEIFLIQKIKEAKDTEISWALCIWHDNNKNVDLPSFAFRELLLDLNPKNSETSIFVMTKDDISAMKLSATMK